MSPKQQKALAFIEARIAETGLSPTFDEIGAHVGGSKSSAYRISEALIAAGHLTRSADRTRALIPVVKVPVVVIRWTERGDPELYVFGGGQVRLLCIDEACPPHDRVFEVLKRFPLSELTMLVPEGAAIGSSRDPNHAALAHGVVAAAAGRPHLEAVR